MTMLHLMIPPLPHYIIGGFAIAKAGRKHPTRRNTGVFDLLVVTKGCLYIGEEGRDYEVREGHFLILRPDAHHYATQACQGPTAYFWIHFQTAGSWHITDQTMEQQDGVSTRERIQSNNFFTMPTFTKQLPQFAGLLHPTRVSSLLRQLTELNWSDHIPGVKWKQQVMFQEIMEQLSASREQKGPSPSALCAEQAASYLREHYRENVTAHELSEAVNFHPVYIARCMQKEFGCAPFDYLMRFRLEQAKLLLLQTDLAIARIAEEVGFNQAAYFASCFSRYEGLSPRRYRQRFSHG